MNSGSSFPPAPLRQFLSTIVVILPALDEEDSVAAVVRQWLALGCGWVRVVDNGSADQTKSRAIEAGAEVLCEPRRGYGAAAWTGAQDLPAGAEWVLFASADGSDHLDAASVEAFFDAAVAGFQFVLGERLSRAGSRRHLTTPQRFGNALSCSLIRLGWGARFRDMGSLRLIRRQTFGRLDLRDRAFGWNIEMQIRAVETGTLWVELPVDYRPRSAGVPKISGSLRGVFKAGSGILVTLARLWVTRSRRFPIQPCLIADPTGSDRDGTGSSHGEPTSHRPMAAGTPRPTVDVPTNPVALGSHKDRRTT